MTGAGSSKQNPVVQKTVNRRHNSQKLRQTNQENLTEKLLKVVADGDIHMVSIPRHKQELVERNFAVHQLKM